MEPVKANKPNSETVKAKKQSKEKIIENMPDKHYYMKMRPFPSDSSCESAWDGVRENYFSK